MLTNVAAILGASSILLGAFGAHGLSDKVSAEKLANWQTASIYHLAHAVAILALVLYAKNTTRSVSLSVSLMTLGIVFFSGSIYTLVLGGPRWLGPITPIGGLLLAAGWLSLIPLLAK